jgi:hypothetical protein
MPCVSAWSATSTTGTAAATRCACAASAACGNVPARRGRRRALQVRTARPARPAAAAEGRPYRTRRRAAAGHRQRGGAAARTVPARPSGAARPTRMPRRSASTRCTWRRGGASPRSRQPLADWDELAETLVPYAAGLGFTHLELLPISEHPFDGSWGYQPLGLYAPTARFGDSSGLRRFVDRAHAAGLGVICSTGCLRTSLTMPMDWPASTAAPVRIRRPARRASTRTGTP